MEREIKFRAWDKINKVMYFPEILLNNPIETGYLDDSGCPKYQDDIVIQYTGLNDKNGKEIYEGDLIQVFGSKRLFSVRWNTEQCGYYLFYLEIREWSMPLHKTVGANDYEVIGNIYENPELVGK